MGRANVEEHSKCKGTADFSRGTRCMRVKSKLPGRWWDTAEELRFCLQVSEGHGEGHDGSCRDSTLAVTERLEAGGGLRRWQGSGKRQGRNWKMEESRREHRSISSPSEALYNRLCGSLSSTPPIPRENQGATSHLTIRKDSEWMNTGGWGEEK